MPLWIDFSTLSFREPLYLWLLAAPGVLLVVWTWHVLRRRRDERRLLRERVMPVVERRPLLGDLAFWAAVGLATILCILALARPVARVSLIRRASADIVILQDGSASMHVTDVAPDRWRRSIQFMRVFGETLSWKGDPLPRSRESAAVSTSKSAGSRIVSSRRESSPASGVVFR